MPAATRISAAPIVMLHAALMVFAARQMHAQQAILGTGDRSKMELWLREQSALGDAVVLEPLGNFRHVSRLKILDFPGITAPQVVTGIRPIRLVLRPVEDQSLNNESAMLRKTYENGRGFETCAAIKVVPMLPGRGYLKFDSVLRVYRRADAAESRP